MPSEKTTRQGQAWDQLAKESLGDEKRLGLFLAENPDEMDTIIFGGEVRLSVPDAPRRVAATVPPPWERM